MAMLRKLGKLAGVLLEDQLARQRQAYGSELTRERQEEVYRNNIADKVMTNLAPKLASGDITPDAIEGFDTMPPELQSVLRAHASTAPSAEQRKGEVMAGVNKNIVGAKSPDELGTLGGRFDEARNALHAKRLPIGLDDVTNLANSFNGQADQLANADITQRDRDLGDTQKKFDIEHPERPILMPQFGPDGKPKGMFIYDKTTGEMRPPTPDDDLRNAQVEAGHPQFNNGVPYTPPLDQTRLEREYRNILMREYSSRSGSLGVEEGKINQASHLKAIFDQNYDPRTGGYNIPKSMMNEVALGLARLTSPGGTVGVELMKELKQDSLTGDFSNFLSYVTGEPVTGNSQDIIKMFKDSIDRQAQVAVKNRQMLLNGLKTLAPTDLDPERKDAIDQGFFKSLNYYDQGAPGSGGSGDGWKTLPGGVRVREKQ